MNIVIPAAGRGQRFREAGYDSKPFIDVGGKPMLLAVAENLRLAGARVIWLVRQGEHERARALKQDATIVPVHGLTQGAACTVLLAGEYIDNDEPLIIANSDQLLDVSIQPFAESDLWDGWMIVFRAGGSKWSYARCDDHMYVREVAEKMEISELATAGIYYFRHGSDFCAAAREMIRKDIRVGGEFYVAPVYNELILAGKQIRAYKIDPSQMHGLGTPEDLRAYTKGMRAVVKQVEN